MNVQSKFTGAAQEQVETPAPVTVEEDGYVRVTSRLNAWWQGDEAGPASDGNAQDRTSLDIALDEGIRDHFDNWDEMRARVAESIWGEGFINPGSGRFLTKCMAPARISKKRNILDLSAGLGGTAIMLAREAGVWVDGIEPIPSLVAKAQRIISSTPVSAQIDIHQVDYDKLVIPPDNYHVIYSRERLFATRFKERLIEQVASGLKAGGQFLLLDYVVVPAHENIKIVKDWISTEAGEVHPWTMGDYRSAFKKAGLDVPAPDNFSEAMAVEINAAWSRMLARLENGTIDRSLVNNILVEGDIWQKRINALRSGKVKLIRFNGTKRA